MLYADQVGHALLNRQANRVDLEAFSYLLSLADAAMIRKMEGAEITMERLEVRPQAKQERPDGRAVFCSFIGPRRRGFHPVRATSTCSLEDVKWDDRRRHRQLTRW